MALIHDPGTDHQVVARPAEEGRPPANEPRPGSPLLGLGAGLMTSSPRLRLAIRLGELAVAVGVSVVSFHSGTGGRVLAVTAIVVCCLAWSVWIAVGDRRRLVAGTLLVMAAVAGAAPSSALVFVGVAAAGLAFGFDLAVALALVSPALVTFTVVALAEGSFPGRLSAFAAVALLGLVSGGGRRQLLLHGRQATLLATAEQRARLARHEAELTAERNRLGRELHDVLAHTLGAVSIQLTALDARVASGDDAEAVRDRIGAIHRLVGDGLGEAREAVRALREDGVPVVDQLRSLGDLHGAAFEVEGRPCALRPEATLVLYRVAQEALTNAAKHAAGSVPALHLGFDAGAVRLTVDNGPGPGRSASPLAGTGGGHGLVGMRERVEALRGHLEAGPSERGWRVTATLPVP